jgi:hypothetical protein
LINHARKKVGEERKGKGVGEGAGRGREGKGVPYDIWLVSLSLWILGKGEIKQL